MATGASRPARDRRPRSLIHSMGESAGTTDVAPCSHAIDSVSHLGSTRHGVVCKSKIGTPLSVLGSGELGQPILQCFLDSQLFGFEDDHPDLESAQLHLAYFKVYITRLSSTWPLYSLRQLQFLQPRTLRDKSETATFSLDQSLEGQIRVYRTTVEEHT